MDTYENAIKYLNSFLNYEQLGFQKKIEFNLDKLKVAFKKLDNPQETFKVIHIAGTKGKGSVCTYAESILRASGYTTGLFTSPHLYNVTERIQVNGETINEKEFVDIFHYLNECLGDKINEEFTYFEILTIAAAVYFRSKKVEIAVFETGMGGRLDATNVLNAQVCAITPVSYDHMQFLGETIEKIAREKSAIIKENSKCVLLPQKMEAMKEIKNRCSNVNADLVLVGGKIKYYIKTSDIGGTTFDISGIYGYYSDCFTRMPGVFQVENCSAGIGLCEIVIGKDKIDPDLVKKGIENAFIPGRLEVISRNPFIVLDGAQNAASAAALKYSIEQIGKYDKLILLIGISKDKDIKGFCKELVPAADEVIVTRSSNPRALDPYVLRGYIRGNKVYATKDIKEALGVALGKVKKKGMILVAGSFFLVAEVRKLVVGSNKRV